ncbi:MAG TPA: hypothetical protein VFE61_12360 [Candidatus Sulfotelmatobacter sp.]|nr:hypothetical protein [Candidatus Sulfotelmatobacter sp.]
MITRRNEFALRAVELRDSVVSGLTFRSLSGEPCFRLVSRAEHSRGSKVLAGKNFEHSHHAIHGVIRGDDGKDSEVHLAANRAKFRGDRINLAAFWHEISLAKVQQNIQNPETFRVLLQGSKMANYLGKGQRAGADGTDDLPSNVDAIRNRHDNPKGGGYHA